MSPQFDLSDPDAMAFCPSCGSGYTARVTHCKPCGVALVPRRQLEAAPAQPESTGVSVEAEAGFDFLYVVGGLMPISLVLAVLPSALLLMLLFSTITQLPETFSGQRELWIIFATWLATGAVILQGSRAVRALFYRAAVLSTLASWALLFLAVMAGGEGGFAVGFVAFLPALACPIVAFVARPRRRSSSSGAP